MTRKNKIWLIIGIIAAGLMITKPSVREFKSVYSLRGKTDQYNFFLFAIYECQGTRVIAGVGNFYKIYQGEWHSSSYRSSRIRFHKTRL